MKVTIQRPTAAGVRYVTLPDSVLDTLGWKPGETVYIEPVTNKAGNVTHVILEKR